MKHADLEAILIYENPHTKARYLTDREALSGRGEFAFDARTINPKLCALFEASPILYQALTVQNVGLGSIMNALSMIHNGLLDPKLVLPEIIDTLMFMQDQILMAQHLTREGVSKSGSAIAEECKRIGNIGK